MVWDQLPMYPACNRINLTNIFDMNILVPKQIFISVFPQNNLRISIYPEDINLALKRPLKSSMLDYSGPDMSNPDLSKPISDVVILKFSQFIDSELDKDKNCVKYPNQKYTNYAECDENYVYNQFATKYKPILPFWAVRDLTKVTSLRSYHIKLVLSCG